MTDPNTVYKARFRELTELLGRAPVSSDPGWWAMHEEYKAGWLPAEETVHAPRVAEVRAREAEETLCARHGWGCVCRESLSGPGINAEGGEAASEPEPPANKPGAAEGLIEGDRGPGGGIVGKCEACGRLWERPARRGRPAAKCEECR